MGYTLEVAINWLYILVHCTVIGSIFFTIVYKLTNYMETNFGTIVMSGIAIIAVYSQYFSLFYKVGFGANVVLIALEILDVILIVLYVRPNVIINIFYQSVLSIIAHKWKIIAISFLFLLYAFNTAREPIHIDTYLYHAQSIRWIEEYGIVKGLGNLHKRFAYNSSVFSFQALFSMAFWKGKSLHTINGFMIWLITSIAACNIKIHQKKTIAFTDVICFMIFFINITPDNISSMQSDTFMENITAFIVLRLFSLYYEKEKNYVPYAVLTLLALFDTTVKISAALIVLIVIRPLYLLVSEKKSKKAILWSLLGVFIVAPFLIRNVMISGYILYPVYNIDLFNVWWKMPKSVVEIDAREIAYWARNLNDTSFSMYDKVGFLEWFPHYFMSQNMKYKLLIFLDVIVFPFYLARIVVLIRSKLYEKLLYYLVVLGCFSFWFMQAPLPRYGKVWIVLMIALPVGEVTENIASKSTIMNNWYLAVVLSWAAIFIMLFPAIKSGFNMGNLVTQHDYRVSESISYQVDGVEIYAPKGDDLPGYHMFPSSREIMTGLYLRKPGDISKGIGSK